MSEAGEHKKTGILELTEAIAESAMQNSLKGIITIEVTHAGRIVTRWVGLGELEVVGTLQIAHGLAFGKVARGGG